MLFILCLATFFCCMYGVDEQLVDRCQQLLKTYDKREAQETYQTWYTLATMLEERAQEDSSYDWQSALECYLKAYHISPLRAEPLIRIANHYLKEGNHPMAFLFAHRALALPTPADDAPILEKAVYTYGRYQIVSVCAWYVGEFQAGEQALRTAIRNHPDYKHLAYNLGLYLDRRFAQGDWAVKGIDLGSQSDRDPKEWSILICTLPERNQTFSTLVAELKRQIVAHNLQDRIEILYFSDNRECPVGFKRNKLMHASKGIYLNFIDDDDTVHQNYIKMIYDKLQSRPDCVSLVGTRTVDGKWPHQFIHSIKYPSFYNPDGTYAFAHPPNHLNPIKRDIAVQFSFPIVNWGEDTQWATALAQSHLLTTEEEIHEPYYFYNYVNK